MAMATKNLRKRIRKTQIYPTRMHSGREILEVFKEAGLIDENKKIDSFDEIVTDETSPEGWKFRNLKRALAILLAKNILRDRFESKNPADAKCCNDLQEMKESYQKLLDIIEVTHLMQEQHLEHMKKFHDNE